MKPELDSLIRQFRDAQDIAVSVITEVLRIPLPRSGPDWVKYCWATELQKRRELGGIPIYAHGFGIELSIGSLKIDFDWGPNGEPDGFDVWRLYNFTLDNSTGVACTHEEVLQWVDEAYAIGELQRSGDTYFDPRRRALAAPSVDEPSDARKPPNGAS
ncbi:MAG: DUF6896 domain-containing protein [Aureliella sp.]